MSQSSPGLFVGFADLKTYLGERFPVPVTFLLSLALAYLVDFSLNFLIGMISIYAIGVRRITWVYHSIVRFFSGQMVPLWIFPPLLGQIAALLPPENTGATN